MEDDILNYLPTVMFRGTGCFILILIHYIEVYLPESTSFQDVQSRKFEAENHLDPEIRELIFY